MNDEYKSMHQQAVRLQFRFRDSVDDKSQPSARQLEGDIQRLVDDMEAQKNPRVLEDQIDHIKQALNNQDSLSVPIMDNRDASVLCDDFEELRMNLRELDNY